MGKMKRYRFTIDAYTPSTMPMARLAEYMADLATMLGELAAVHFIELEEGSTVLVHAVDHEAEPKVEARLKAVRDRSGPPDAMTAYQRINKKLREDNGVGVLTETLSDTPAPQTAEILRFPGRETVEPVAFGAFNQLGSLDGVPIVVGGQKDPVPVHLEAEGEVHNCLAPRTLAREIAKYLFTSYLRVHGLGRWRRDEDGRWVLEKFRIDSYEELKDQPLSEVVRALRNVKGNEWETMSDPWGELAQIRDGGNGKR